MRNDTPLAVAADAGADERRLTLNEAALDLLREINKRDYPAEGESETDTVLECELAAGCSDTTVEGS